MKNAPRLFLVALQFLTRLPVHLQHAPDLAETGKSILYYPLVGLLLGVLLLLPQMLLTALGLNPAPALMAALMLFLWVWLTGALHVDGLGDSADGWLGGFGDRQRTLTIMKDSRSGIAAIAAVVCVLLLKFAALQTVLSGNTIWPVLLAPLLGRCAVLGLVISTPYIATSQLGADLASHCPRRPAIGVLAVSIIAITAVGLLAAPAVLIAVPAALLCIAELRRQMLRRLGGATGDTTGATVECVEAATLVSLALVL